MSTGCIRKAEKAQEIPPANADLRRWPISNPPDLIEGGDLEVKFPTFAKFKLHDVSESVHSRPVSTTLLWWRHGYFTNKWFRIETTWDSGSLFFAILDLLGSTDTLNSSSSLKSSIDHVKRKTLQKSLSKMNIVRIEIQHVISTKSFGLLSPQVVSVKIFVYTQRGVWGVRPNDWVA